MTGVPLLTPAAVARLAGAGLLGLVVGAVGTVVHRAVPPWGLLLALLAVVVLGALLRAWQGWAGMLAGAMGVFTVTWLMGVTGPGGDVLVAADWRGLVWFVGALAVGAAGLLPRTWFSDRPIRGTSTRTVAVRGDRA